MSPKAKSTRKKAAAERKHRAAGIKAAAKRKHRAAGIKAAAKRKHRAADKKAKATLEAKKRQVQPAAAPRVVTRTIGKAEITEVPATAPAPGPQEPGSQTETTGPTEPKQS
jgi:hypothetical protein